MWKWFDKAKIVFGFMALDMCSDRMVLDTIVNVVTLSQSQIIESLGKKRHATSWFCLIVVAYQYYGYIWIIKWVIRKLFYKAVQDDD